MMGSRPGPVPPGDYGGPVTYLDHEPHAMSRFAAMGLFAFLWAGAAAIALWRSSPPGGAAFMFWTGIVVAAGAGYWVAQIRRLQARRRLYLLLAIVCLGLPFGLAAVFG